MHPHASESPIVTTHLGPMNYSSANEEGAFDLAVELFVNIFEQLDLQSLLRCCLVSILDDVVIGWGEYTSQLMYHRSANCSKESSRRAQQFNTR